MATNDIFFVEWKEHFVSKERGNRVVHYFLKDSAGESILAVVGTERSVRHMFYVVSEDFLKAFGGENSVHSGFRWRSRREVVNWLTSMLSKQHQLRDCSKSPIEDPASKTDTEQTVMPDHKGRITRNLTGKQSDIIWSGIAWICGKQLKHYPAFLRNGIAIAIQSFVYVMAEKEIQYIAYLEDMYEDKKGQKKVKVRWFHYNREVRGVTNLRNPDPKEVFITSYAQVISAECVDGPAIVLTRGHYDKCSTIFPDDLLTRIHFCSRQFKSNRLKPFKLSKLRGYQDQPIFSCFSPDFFEDEECSSGYDGKNGKKRGRNGNEAKMMQNEPLYKKLKYDLLDRRLKFQKQVKEHTPSTLFFKVNDKIEFLCQDSGIRGCWFRCIIMEISKRQIKIQYEDLKDDENCGNLEEWVSARRLAKPDKLGMRSSNRLTVRPAVPGHQGDMPGHQVNVDFNIGAPVDVWWSDGWWEGVVIGTSENESYQVFCPGENLVLQVMKNNLRVSRDWVEESWVNVPEHPDILSVISEFDVKLKDIKEEGDNKEACTKEKNIELEKVLNEENNEHKDNNDTTTNNNIIKDGCENLEDETKDNTDNKTKEIEIVEGQGVLEMIN